MGLPEIWDRIGEQLLIGIAASIPALLLFINDRRKRLIEESDSAVEAWRSFVEPLRAEVRDLRTQQGILEAELGAQRKQSQQEIGALQVRIAALEKERDFFRNGVYSLIDQMTEHGLEPDWEPIDWSGTLE